MYYNNSYNNYVNNSIANVISANNNCVRDRDFYRCHRTYRQLTFQKSRFQLPLCVLRLFSYLFDRFIHFTRVLSYRISYDSNIFTYTVYYKESVVNYFTVKRVLASFSARHREKRYYIQLVYNLNVFVYRISKV